MWSFLRRQLLYFLVGFVITFVIYLFVEWEADKVVTGAAIAIAGGIVLSLGLFFLERRFPEQTPPPPSDG
jgi:cell division protein FtsW (lipid II flippase)